MISRVWHGWTTAQKADKYHTILNDLVFPEIAAKNVLGYKEIQLFRGAIENDEVEFITVMWFDSWDAVKQFAGEDMEQAYVPSQARAVLSRFDERSQHYEIIERREY